MSLSTQELLRKAQSGDRDAGETLLNENTGLIWSVVRRFLGRGTDPEDLYQLGCLGFLKAVAGFDPEFGTQFSTYAVPKIAGEIRRFLRDDGAVKVSRSVKEQAGSIRLARTDLTGKLGREPTLREISEATGLTPEQIAVAESATAATESIQQENGEEGFTLENVLTDTAGEGELVEKIALRQAVDALEPREAMVIRLRYYHGLTQSRVAAVMQVSQVQISRIEKKALCHFRTLLE